MPVAPWPAYLAICGCAALSIASFTTLALRTPHPVPRRVVAIELQRVEITGHVETAEDAYYDALRAQIHWVPTRVGRETLLAPDAESRLLLARSAADRAGLAEVGLTYADVYAIINAETSWVPREGASRDGTPNLGIAQFEPATAKALGLRHPDDPVEAVHAAALHIREAALWSRERLRGLKLARAQRAEKLREGISVYYNLSTRGRNQWTGLNTDELPVETQRHILNARLGEREAQALAAQLGERVRSRARELITADAGRRG